VTIIPNPVEPPVKADPELVAKLMPPARVPGVKTFVFLGRLERQKRPDWLLKAWKLALDTGMKNTRLLLLGEGSWRSQCEQIIRDKLMSDTVKLLGHRVDAAAYLQNADGLLLTSLYEGHANVVLEAQALGVPVLAMDADGVRESFSPDAQAGLVPVGDVMALAKKLCELAAGEPVANPCAAISLSKEQHAQTCRVLMEKILNQAA